MSDQKLEEVFPFLKSIDAERREQFCEYFKHAPVWILSSFSVSKLEKGKVFIREGTPVDTIFFVIDGLIKAIDYQIYGIQFDFVLFHDVYAYGGMEVLIGLEKYQTSMQAITECTVVKIPKPLFEKWMNTDILALRYESKQVGKYLLEQARRSRAFLFLQGADRLTMLLINRYEKFAEDQVLRIRADRQELSAYTGLSVKTITRAVQKLESLGYVSREGSKIVVDEAQYEKMKEALSEIVDCE